jgi:hypothetical protein
LADAVNTASLRVHFSNGDGAIVYNTGRIGWYIRASADSYAYSEVESLLGAYGMPPAKQQVIEAEVRKESVVEPDENPDRKPHRSRTEAFGQMSLIQVRRQHHDHGHQSCGNDAPMERMLARSRTTQGIILE